MHDVERGVEGVDRRLVGAVLEITEEKEGGVARPFELRAHVHAAAHVEQQGNADRPGVAIEVDDLARLPAVEQLEEALTGALPDYPKRVNEVAKQFTVSVEPLSVQDRRIAETLGPVLAARGLLLVGLDVIGDYLTEVNVTSPTCFREIQDQTGFDVSGVFLDSLEKEIKGKAP